LTNQPGPPCLPVWRANPVRGDSSSPDRLAPGPRPGSAWWASSCPPHDAPRRTRPAPRCPRTPRGPLNRPPCLFCRLLPPAGQALGCSARAVAGSTQSRRQVSKGDAARGRPCAGNAALGPHAQPALPPDCACDVLPRTGQEMRQATIFIRRPGNPGRASACTTLSCSRRRVAVHHHVPGAVLTRGGRPGGGIPVPRPAALPRVTADRLGRRRQGRAGASAARQRQDHTRHLRAPVARHGWVHPGCDRRGSRDRAEQSRNRQATF
jgi:hypothetical protein